MTILVFGTFLCGHKIEAPSDLISDRNRDPHVWNTFRVNDKSDVDTKITTSIFERIFHCDTITIAYI